MREVCTQTEDHSDDKIIDSKIKTGMKEVHKNKQ